MGLGNVGNVVWGFRVVGEIRVFYCKGWIQEGVDTFEVKMRVISEVF